MLTGLLICMLFVQVVHQVDLPDTAFHRNTAPIVAKARFTGASIALTSTVYHLVRYRYSLASGEARAAFNQHCTGQKVPSNPPLFSPLLNNPPDLCRACSGLIPEQYGAEPGEPNFGGGLWALPGADPFKT